MDSMLFVLGVLLAALGIGLSIGLHEVGHMVPAKRFGVRVPQYMVGFGPTLWSKRGRETEYGVKWIPLGGYIRMIGMFPPPKGAPDGHRRPRHHRSVPDARRGGPGGRLGGGPARRRGPRVLPPERARRRSWS